VSNPIKPNDAKDVEAAVQWAVAQGKTLEIIGHGSKRGLGRPAQTDATLDLSGLTGVTLYEPEELVLSARAGTPMSEIEELLARHMQALAFEPMDYSSLLGVPPGLGTIGGALATNLSGSRRLKAGAARDHFLGVTAISGRGETFKSGGRVVKNVTGYDLCKLMVGAWGTLAAMTEVTIKVLPAPETEATLLIRGLAPEQAIVAMTSAMGSACDPSGAAHLPAAATARLPASQAAGAGGSALTALRLEGFAPSVAHRRRLLEALMQPIGELAALDAPASRALWLAIRDATLLARERGGRERPLWRLSTAPSRGAELAALIARQAEAEMLFDWAGGLIWLALDGGDDAGAALLRSAVTATGGHATLIRSPAAVRAASDVFSPQDAGLAALTKRIKASFDPSGVLNPGRMWAGV
jgi:glycolate oxidase FAD binding subunit